MIDPDDFETPSADVIDVASQQEQRTLAAHIAAASAPLKKRLPVTPGLCDYCGDPVDTPTRLFCTAECRDGDELEQKMRVRNGLR